MSAEFEYDGDAIAVAFVQEGGRDLPGWAARHPEHARTLAQLASHAHFGAPMADSSRVREVGLAVLAARRPALTGLLQAAKAQGLGLDETAGALSLPEGLLWKLHRRLVAFESVPAALITRLAETLRRSTEEVRTYLAQPPQLAVGASYRADEAPETVQESFAEALGTDPETTDAMRDHWLTR
jgi:hypothetical protein